MENTIANIRILDVVDANGLQACVVDRLVKLAFGAITRLCFTR
jgi:hypothetical protein